MTDDAAPWCHTCDAPLTDAVALQAPTDDPSVVELWCARCLTGPGDEK